MVVSLNDNPPPPRCYSCCISHCEITCTQFWSSWTVCVDELKFYLSKLKNVTGVFKTRWSHMFAHLSQQLHHLERKHNMRSYPSSNQRHLFKARFKYANFIIFSISIPSSCNLPGDISTVVLCLTLLRNIVTIELALTLTKYLQIKCFH